MFDSGIPANELVQNLKSEVDIANEIPDYTYMAWLNSLEQLLYSEFIKEQGKILVTGPAKNKIAIKSLPVPAGESPVRFEDIYTIYADGVQLIKSTLASGVIFPNTYFKVGVDLGYHTDDTVGEMTIIYFVRPAVRYLLFGNVMVPYEFIELVKAKLRGEAYKLCNEDAAAAKWLNDYNALLDGFQQWLLLRRATFGM